MAEKIRDYTLMNTTVVLKTFILAFLMVSIGFYLLGYQLSDVISGGVVGGLGVAVGISIRSYLT